MSDCKYLVRMGAYYDGEVGIEERGEMAAHVLGCRACREELEGLRRLSGTLAEAGGWELAGDVLARIQAGVEREAERSVLRAARGLLAVAAGLLVVLTVWVARQGSAEVTPAAWEQPAANPQADANSLSGSPQLAIAEWQVEDLSRGSRHE